MGFLDRLSGTVTGLAGAIHAPIGLVWDVTRAPFGASNDQADGNIASVLYHSTVVRGGDLFENLFGPNEGLGAALNAVPGSVRAPVGGVINDAFDGLEWLGREGIREPMSTAMIAASLADSPEFGDRGPLGLNSIGRMFRGDVWSQAHAMAQDTSVGQAVAIAIGTRDILDENEVAEFVNTDFFEITSGTTDFLVRLTLEPDAIVLGPGVAARRSGAHVGIGSARGRLLAAPANLPTTARIPGIGSFEIPGARAITDGLAANFDNIPGGVRWMVTNYTANIDQATAAEIRGLTAQSRRARRLGRADEAERLARRASRIESSEIASQAQQFAAHTRARDIEQFMQAPAQHQFLNRTPLMSSPSYAKFDSFVTRLIDDAADTDEAVALVRDALLPDHHHGDVMASMLVDAATQAERRMVMRFFMGDMDSFRAAKTVKPALAARFEDLIGQRGTVLAEPDYNLAREGVDGQLSLRSLSPVEMDRVNYPERLDALDDEIADVISQHNVQARNETTFRAFDEAPNPGLGTEVRYRIKRSDFYQTSRYARPLRVMTNMRPQHLLNMADPTADGHFERMLRDAGFEQARINQFRGRFARASLDERALIYRESIEAAERLIMEQHGMSRVEVDQVLAHANRGRNGASDVIQRGIYDGEGRARIRHADGEWIEQPIMTSQLEHVVSVTNWKRLRHEAERYARIQHGEGWRAGMARTQAAQNFNAFTDASTVVLDNFMSTWKIGTLLRPAWTFRVVVLDEQMRMAAKFGALTSMLAHRGALNQLGLAIKNHDTIGRVLGMDDVGKASRRGAASGALVGMTAAGAGGAVVGAGLGYGMLRHLAKLEDAGVTNLNIGAYRAAAAYGNGSSKADIYRAQVSAGNSLREFAGAYEAGILGRWRENADQWTTHSWKPADDLAQAKYRESWSRVISRHHQSDPMARMVLDGSTVDDILAWFDTIEGRQHASRVPLRGRSSRAREQWAEAVHDQVVAYTGGEGDIGQAARAAIAELGEDAKQREWDRILDSIPEGERPIIHGPEFEQVMGSGSQLVENISSAVETSFDLLGTMATDELSRNPTFRHMYEQEMRRLIGDIPAGVLDAEDLARFEDSARRFALRETRELLYDLAEQSEFAGMTRILLPFFPAGQEVLTRWVGLAWENPVIIPRMHDLWNAPNRAGWTYTDDQGEDQLVIRVPEFARGLLGSTPFFQGALDSQGQIRLPKQGFNLILTNPIGFGPFVQIPASTLVRERPELEDAMSFILPFGPQDTVNSILPAVVRDGIVAGTGALGMDPIIENRAYTSAYARNLVTQLTNMQRGLTEQVDLNDPVARGQFLQSVQDETNAFWALRTTVRFISPVAPIYDSPYQPYIDVFRAMSNDDATRAAEIAASIPGVSVDEQQIAAMIADGDTDEAFLALFGPEFFAVTTRLSQSNNGVPPTLEALETQGNFSELIQRHPDWGGVIIGRDGGGEAVKFSRAAYDRQLDTPLQPGSAIMQRERKTPGEIIDDAPTRLGWAEYSRAMDAIDAARMQRGLPNLNVNGASDLRQAKTAIIDALASRYPQWFADFSVTDRNRWNVKIEGARAVAADTNLAGRDDIRGLNGYLQLRDAVIRQMAARGSSNLNATGNTDLASAFNAGVVQLIDSNPAFADLYYRMLERDPLDPDSLAA